MSLEFDPFLIPSRVSTIASHFGALLENLRARLEIKSGRIKKNTVNAANSLQDAAG